MPTKKRVADQLTMAARYDASLLEFDPLRAGGIDIEQHVQPFPFPLTSTLKVLGVTIDEFFTLDDHLRTTLAKAPARLNILRRVTNSP